MSLKRISVKRIYEPPEASDGKRILVERLWPRGISKERADLFLWMKYIAPSPELRKWYNHQIELWPMFREKYTAELSGNPKLVSELLEICQQSPVTLVYASKDEEYNSTVVLRDFLQKSATK